MTGPSAPRPAGPLVCRWCRIPLTTDRARWWDNQPECRDPHACTDRIWRTL
ncbi:MULTISPECIES: hypothetical protein [Streptomyces]|uniref:Uncharacterized protein n=1 Tax=Streptomyces fradiae ATCC 10745 = DSM 40063 TaxID=1319510 RepID=A0A1Y2NN38_STRFR|nr:MULTISPECIES: hypothetical protein [Streptomyces]OSY48810.1 hypothetical protein BG846_05603 [Streptomyces fradiae ATCC 10745 = DSM 40063]OSY50423.1 hypothetical protein BG846_03999 [Streptomyces fradiae ATCC 10745 = DSM 40063]OSY50637.1 hypothetical protein BG846_03805 [Streptomyces fradiae ATCC 10745 = DSM 40063]